MKFFTIAELCKSTTADRLGINNSKQWLSLSGT